MRVFTIISVLAVLTPAVPLANDEVSLGGLAELIEALSDSTDDLKDRAGRWNRCFISVDIFAARDLDLQSVWDETVLKYKEQYGGWIDLNEVRISSILYNC